MKHLIKFDNIDEAKQSLRSLFKFKYTTPNVENDVFVREIRCKEHAPKYLTKDKKYRLYAEFETGAMLSGKCFVVLADNNEFIAIDSEYFMEEYQWVASRKYNL